MCELKVIYGTNAVELRQLEHDEIEQAKRTTPRLLLNSTLKTTHRLDLKIVGRIP